MALKRLTLSPLTLLFVLLALAGLMAFGPTAVPAQGSSSCPAEMISYWKLDETSAPYLDHLGGPNATCTNCPTAVAGLVNGAQQFDKVDDEVSVADQEQFDWGVGDGFSIEYWMKSASNCSGNEVIVGRQGTTHPQPHWWTGCSDTGDQAAFILFDSSGSNGGNNTWAYSGTDITDNQWHHIVAVRDTTHIHLYVDGKVKSSVAKSYTTGFGSTTDLNIGHLNYSPTSRFRYNGLLDEVAVYNRALAPDEIKQQYLNGLAGHGYCEVLAPSIVSSAVTDGSVGAAYTYDVDAVGNPPPTYTLTTAPAGMTIDEDTGEISWTPAAAGSFPVLAATLIDQALAG